MAFRCAYLPTWETQLFSSPDDGSCRRTKFAVTNALWTTRKTKPVFDPLKLPTVQRSGDLGTALLDRLERIYKEGDCIEHGHRIFSDPSSSSSLRGKSSSRSPQRGKNRARPVQER
jgi:hypothetical protein